MTAVQARFERVSQRRILALLFILAFPIKSNAMTPADFAACLITAAHTHHVPGAVLVGIMHVEGGHVGEDEVQADGTHDLGPVLINSSIVPEMATRWKVDQKAAYDRLQNDGCANVETAAWKLQTAVKKAGGLAGGIGLYHSTNATESNAYAAKVIQVMKDDHLMQDKLSDPSKQCLSSTDTAKSAPDYAPSTIVDFIVDQAKLPAGSKLSITGYYMRIAGSEYLTDNPMQQNNVVVLQTDDADRESRKTLLTCTASFAGCHATLLVHTGCVSTRFGMASEEPCLIMDGLKPSLGASAKPSRPPIIYSLPPGLEP